MTTTVLALDLASVSGWAVGEPGGEPKHGSLRFASVGASHEAIFAKAAMWIEQKIIDCNPSTIVWEAPMPTSRRYLDRHANTMHGAPIAQHAVFERRHTLGVCAAGF